MHAHRGLLNWGIFLVCLGAVPLAVQLNAISSGTAASLLRLWPLILIGIGLGLVLRFSRAQSLGGFIAAGTFGLLIGTFFVAGPQSFAAACTGDQPNGTPITRNGPAGTNLDLSVELTCGQMTLSRVPGGAWSVNVNAGNETPTIESSGPQLSLRSVTGARWPFGSDERESWQVVLPTEATLDGNFTITPRPSTPTWATARLMGSARPLTPLTAT